MKKTIAILLLGALLTLSFVGCNEQPNSGVTPNNADNTTTPEVTTPEVTTPNLDVTVPEETTPPLDIDPAPPEPEDNGDTNSPEDKVITFTAKTFLSKKSAGPLTGPIEFTIDHEDITINIPNYLSNAHYESYYVERIELIFPDEITWYAEETEQTLAIYEKLKSSKASYMLQTTKKYSMGFNPAIVYHIDGVYYFVVPQTDSAEVRTIYYATESEVYLPLSDKNTIPSYPEKPQRPTESDPLIIELFGEERIDFTAEIIACLRYFSDWGHWKFTVREGNLYLSDELWCKISYADDVKVHFSQDFVEGINEYKWFVEENEQTMQVMEKITNSEYCYILDIQDSSYLSELLMYDIDGDYYFVMRSPSGIVKKLYRFTLN